MMLNDYFFYIVSWALISLGFYSITEILNINDSLIKKLLIFAFGVLYFISYYKHRKDRNKRIEQAIHDTENKYIERIVNRNNENDS